MGRNPYPIRQRWYKRVLGATLLATSLLARQPAHAADLEISPYTTVNQSPLSQIFGLPSNTDSALVPAGHWAVSLSEDVASDYAVSGDAQESLTLDGESYRTTLALRYGLNDTYEIGAEIPGLYYSGGFLDDTIVWWHSVWGFPQGGRNTAPRNRLLFSYSRDGQPLIDITHDGVGLGDVSLTGGMKLADLGNDQGHDRLALRADLALPTGDPSQLTGSGAPDLSVHLDAGIDRETGWGRFGLYGSLGEMALGQGQVLGDQQNRLVTFGTLGAGWSPSDWGSLKMQLDWNTGFFHDSALPEMSRTALMLVTGGTVALPQDWKLDLDFSEDVAVTTAPDISFNLGLGRTF